MLSKLFKPKWQHAKPEIRAAAAEKMSEAHPDQLKILSSLATQDPDSHVRAMAVSKINTLDTLLSLADQTSASEVAQQLARHLDASQSPADFIARLTQCSNAATLAQVLALSERATQDTQLLTLLPEQQLLRIALNADTIQLRKSAAEQLSSPELIETLAKETRQKDKTIYRLMRDKLDLIREAEKAQREQHAKAQHLNEHMSQLANGEWFPLYAAKVESLIQDWAQLPDVITAEFNDLFNSATRDCQARIKAKADAEQQAAETAKQKQAAQLNITQWLNTWESISVYRDEDTTESLMQLQQTLQQSWQALDLHATASQQAQAQRYFSALNARIAHTEALPAYQEQAQTLLGQAHWDHLATQQAGQLVRDLNWPDTLPKPEWYNDLQTRIREAKAQLQQQNADTQALQTQAKDSLQSLKAAIEHGEIRLADKALRKASALLGQLNGQTPASLEQQYRLLNTQLDELKDWQGYAVKPKKEALCAQMEALINQEMPAPDKARLIKQYQSEWKLLDRTDPFNSRALWQRFKDAADQAYAPCETYFIEQGKVRRFNLEQREQICAALETYLDADNWKTLPLKEVDKVVQTAKQEWRRFIPVDRAPGQEVQARFNHILSTIEEHFNTLRETAKQAKLALINEATALVNAEDPQAAAEHAKALQQQWKAAGPTYHSQEKKLWRQFRDQCDTIFANLQAALPAKQTLQQAKAQLSEATQVLRQFAAHPVGLAQCQALLKRCTTIIDQVGEHLPTRDMDLYHQAASQVIQQEAALNAFVAQADTVAFLHNAQLCDDFEQQLLTDRANLDSEHFSRWDKNLSTPLLQQLNQRREALEALANNQDEPEVDADTLRELCIRLEIALGQHSPESDQALRMEYQMKRLQQALEQKHQQSNLVEVKSLELEWRTVPFSRFDEELQTRFSALLQLAFYR